ncbi:hypothetical protein HDU87_005054 [Geranomyces variabilis]|uniref:Mitochondrial carrier protein n=1 Tax=Geranomyces variabilis TaxID=109894 RepID=A0AAD5XVD4_9FUNG|nr:hypothetical protein HDU87_005054 [Geranomyces variabilis]
MTARTPRPTSDTFVKPDTRNVDAPANAVVSASEKGVAKDSAVGAGIGAAAIAAGMAKAFATKSALAATALGKGILKAWFRVPAKLFRPHAVNPWIVVNAMSAQAGQRSSHAYLRSVVAEEGYGFLGRNVLPFLVANAVAGAVLFNVYAGTSAALARSRQNGESGESDSPSSLNAAMTFDHHHPFVAGALAGASTALISTPIDNVKAMITPEDIIGNRHLGMARFALQTCKKALKDEHSTYGRIRRLYRGGAFLAAKDAAGFGMFFFFFENLRRVGKGCVADAWGLREEDDGNSSLGADDNGPSSERRRRPLALVAANAAAVIGAGAAAGLAYQVVIYPIDAMPGVLAARTITKITKDPALAKAVADAAAPIYEDGFHAAAGASGPAPPHRRFAWREVWAVLRSEGPAPFYRGIAPQLVRVMPPAALGLLAFEIFSSQFWDNDET